MTDRRPAADIRIGGGDRGKAEREIAALAKMSRGDGVHGEAARLTRWMHGVRLLDELEPDVLRAAEAAGMPPDEIRRLIEGARQKFKQDPAERGRRGGGGGDTGGEAGTGDGDGGGAKVDARRVPLELLDDLTSDDDEVRREALDLLVAGIHDGEWTAEDLVAAGLPKDQAAMAQQAADTDTELDDDAFRKAEFPPHVSVLTAGEAAAEPQPVYFASPGGEKGGVLSIGSVGLLAGQGGVGKSALLADLAVAVADPTPMRSIHNKPVAWGGALDLIRGDDKPADVLMLAYEEKFWSVAQAIRRACAVRAVEVDGDRPTAVGAVWRYTRGGRSAVFNRVQERIHIMRMPREALFGPVPRGDGTAGLYNARPGELDGWGYMRRGIDRHKPRLLCIDPALIAYVANANDAASVGDFVVALDTLAEDCGLCVVVVAHSTKGARGGDVDPMDPGLVSGSAAWTDRVRSALVVTHHPDPESTDRVLTVQKSNYSKPAISRIIRPVHNTGEPTIAYGTDPDAGKGRLTLGGGEGAISGWQSTDGWQPVAEVCPPPDDGKKMVMDHKSDALEKAERLLEEDPNMDYKLLRAKLAERLDKTSCEALCGYAQRRHGGGGRPVETPDV